MSAPSLLSGTEVCSIGWRASVLIGTCMDHAAQGGRSAPSFSHWARSRWSRSRWACYVVGLHYVDTCDLGAEIPFVAGGVCVAGAVTLGFLASYRRRCRKPGPSAGSPSSSSAFW